MTAPAYVPARVRTVALLAGGTTVVVGAVLWVLDGRGVSLPRLPWLAAAATAALAVVVLSAGLPVRRWVRGGREQVLDPLVAMRTLVLAKSAAYGGGLLAGWFAAQGLVLLPDLVGDRRGRFLVAMLATAAAVAVSVAGLVVQSWCKLPPPPDDSPPRE
jgi:hypothetical protein